MNRKQKDELIEWAKKATEHIADCSTFMSLWSADIDKDPVPVIQLGYAMMLDKPIIVIAPEGTHIPQNVRRVARSVKFFDPASEESMMLATKTALLEAGVPIKETS